MTIGVIFKIAAVGILVSILSQVLKHSGREEQAFLTSFASFFFSALWENWKCLFGQWNGFKAF